MKAIEKFKKILPETYKDMNLNLSNSFAEAHFDVRDCLYDHKYLLKDGDLGVMLEINSIADEILESEEHQDELAYIQKALRSVVPGLPAYENLGNTTVQIMLSSRRQISAPQKILNGREFSFSNSTTGRFLQSEEDYLFSALNFVKRRFFVTIRFTPNPDNRTLKEKLEDFFSKKEYLNVFKPEQSLDSAVDDLEKAIAYFESEVKNIESHLSARGKVRRVPFNELIAYTQNIINSNCETPVFQESESIQQSINCAQIKPEIGGISNDLGGKTDVYCLNQLPSNYAYGVIRHFIEWIPCPDFDLVWTMSWGTNKPRNEITARIGHFESKKSKIDIAEDFRDFKKSVSSFNPYGIQSLRLLVHNPEEGYESKLQNAANDFLYSQLVKEKQIPIHMIASSLPLNANKFTNGLKGRSRKILLDKALAFMPVYSGPESKDGVSWWLTRSGTAVQFNLFAGDGGKHACVIGLTRVGKSCLTNSIIDDFLEYNSQTIIRGIDIDTSYEKASALIDGEIVKFSEEHLRKNPHSPFALEGWDEQDLENIKFLIKMTILSKNPQANWEGVHDNILLNAIKRAYNAHRENMARKEKGLITGDIAPHPIWENIVAQFSETKIELEKSGVGKIDYVVEDLNKWSISLTEGGDYGFIFSVHQNHSDKKSNRFLIYDLNGIPDPTLRKVASMMASIKIMRDFDRVSRSVQKLFIIDELGQQIRSEKSGDDSKSLAVMGDFIVNLAATAARKNIQLLAITNQVGDYTDNPVGVALWSLSQTHIFLPMGKLYDAAHKAWKGDFNAAEWEIIKDLKLEKQHRRSMVYVQHFNDKSPFQGSLYLPLSPYMDAKNTSSGPQVELYRKLIADGYSPLDAIGFMAENHPYGEGLDIDPRDEQTQKEMIHNENT